MEWIVVGYVIFITLVVIAGYRWHKQVRHKHD